MRDQADPVGALRRRDRCNADPEINSRARGVPSVVIGVGQDVECVTVVIDAVFKPGRAWLDQARLGFRIRGVDQVDFAGLVVRDVNQQVVAGLGFVEVDVEGGVLLLVDEFVVSSWCAEPVAVDVERAVVIVEADVLDGLAVLRPDHAAGAFNDVR